MSRWAPLDREEPDKRRGPTAEFQISRGAAGTDATRLRRGTEERPSRRAGRREVLGRPRTTQHLPLRDLQALIGADRDVTLGDGAQTYTLTAREVRALATIGAFRTIPVDDLVDRGLLTANEVSTLRSEGLVDVDSVGLRGNTRAVATLTAQTQALLMNHRESGPHAPQQFYAGFVKPAELAHDAELFALYEVVAEDIRQRGGTLERIVLDYELKSDYQTFLNRSKADTSPSLDADRLAWATAHDLELVDGRLHLPDFRVEYRDTDGRLRHQDVEYATRHYSAVVVAAKGRAGFAVYRRSSGAGASHLAGAGRASHGRGGGVPRPNLFERLV